MKKILFCFIIFSGSLTMAGCSKARGQSKPMDCNSSKCNCTSSCGCSSQCSCKH